MNRAEAAVLKAVQEREQEERFILDEDVAAEKVALRCLGGDVGAWPEFVRHWYYTLGRMAQASRVRDRDDALTLAVDVLDHCLKGFDGEPACLREWRHGQEGLRSFMSRLLDRHIRRYFRKRVVLVTETDLQSTSIPPEVFKAMGRPVGKARNLENLYEAQQQLGNALWDDAARDPADILEEKQEAGNYPGRDRLSPQERRVADGLRDGKSKEQLLHDEGITDLAFRQVIYRIKQKIGGLRGMGDK